MSEQQEQEQEHKHELEPKSKSTGKAGAQSAIEWLTCLSRCDGSDFRSTKRWALKSSPPILWMFSVVAPRQPTEQHIQNFVETSQVQFTVDEVEVPVMQLQAPLVKVEQTVEAPRKSAERHNGGHSRCATQTGAHHSMPTSSHQGHCSTQTRRRA